MNRYLRCYAEISLEAIGHNIREVKKRLPEGVKLLGVVKANAYGHGAVPVASYLENQVDYFATATIEEAVELRENGISAPILILGYVSPSQYGDLVEYDITQTIDSYAQALALEKEAARQNRKAKAHLAVDTGMRRQKSRIFRTSSWKVCLRISPAPIRKTRRTVRCRWKNMIR